MAYFLSYLLRSISIAMIPTLCYSFLAIVGSGSKAPVWSFYEPEGMSAFMFGTKYVWFILMGVLFFALGWILNKCYTSYWIFTESWGMWALYKGNLAKNKEKLLVFSLLSYIMIWGPKGILPLIWYTNCSVATQLPHFYTHSESVDFPRKITTSSCVCGSTSQSSYPASRNEFWPFDPCII